MRNVAIFITVLTFTLTCHAQGTIYSWKGNDLILQNDSGLHISNYRKTVDYGSVKAQHLFIKYDTNSNYWVKNDLSPENKSEHALTILNFRGEMLYQSDRIRANLVSHGKQWCLFRLGDTSNLLAGITGNISLNITGKSIATQQLAILQLEGKPNTTNIITTVPQGITKGRIFRSKKNLKNAAMFNEFSFTTSKGELLHFPSGTFYLFAAKSITLK
jgi:hypothetical protein